MNTSPRFWAVVPAAGLGRRMGTDIPKQYLDLAGRKVLEHTLDALLGFEALSAVAVSLQADDPWWPNIAQADDARVIRADGGAERFHSVLNGLLALQERAAADDWVMVHDAARPCIRLEDLQALQTQLADHPVGGLLAVPVADTMKRADAAQAVAETVERDGLWRAFTPQMFRYGALCDALQAVVAEGAMVTDEAQAMERLGHSPALVEGHDDNIKITRPQDLALAGYFLNQQGRAK